LGLAGPGVAGLGKAKQSKEFGGTINRYQSISLTQSSAWDL